MYGLGKGLKMLLMPVNGRLIDTVNPTQIWAPQNSAAVVGTHRGMAAGGGLTDHWTSTGYSNISGNVGTFFCWFTRIGDHDASGHIMWGSDTTTNVYFQLGVDTDTKGWCFSQQVTGMPTLTAAYNNTNRSEVYSSDGTAAGKSIYLQGVDVGTANGSTPSSFAAGSKTFAFGKWNGGNNWDTDADCLIAGFTDEVWTEQQAYSDIPIAMYHHVHHNLGTR
jgi:hypothetical protein